MLFRRLIVSSLALGIAGCAQLGSPGQDIPAIPPASDTQQTDISAIGSNTDFTLPAGITLLERVSVAPGEVGIPFEKYQLENGLTVILHEDNSDPLVHVDVTYHVGSGREEPGRSGFAHFFEHMMFQGSENVADEEHFKIISEAGGTLNGTTNTDRTNYFETLPSNQLEKALWLEADRMGFFLDAVTQEKFEIQRETVKNERGQNYDNRPYGLLWERVGEAVYPEGHPYSWSTIGYIDDLNRADVNDLKRFFLRWYGPNNATLSIGGDLDRTQTLAWIARYFGSIPRGPEVGAPEYTPVTLDTDRYISMEDNVSLPLLFMATPTVHARHPDEAPLDVLMSIMGEGRTSLLYKNLVKSGLAVNAGAGHGCQELSCLFTLSALPNPASGASLSDLEALIRKSLTEFETRGVMDDDLERVKTAIVSGMIYNLESVSGKMSRLAFYETFASDPDYTAEDIARYENVTREDVMRVYETYIKNKPAVIMSIVPKGQADQIAAPDTWTMYERTIPDATHDTSLEMRYAQDDFDRSVQPPASDRNPSVKLPAIWRAALSNGVEILGAANTETPTTALSLRIEAGQRRETLDKLGLASLTADMLNEATQMSTNEELSNRLDKLGSSISISSGSRYTTITVHALSETLDDTLAIVRERLLFPKFDPEDFARIKDQRLQNIEQMKTRASSTAGNVFNLLTYGRDNPSAFPDIGLTETVTSITLDDVKAFYAANYSAAASSIIAVSDLDQTTLKSSLSILSDWTGETLPPAKIAPFPELKGGVLYLIDKDDAAQSEIRIGKRALPFDASGEYYRAQLMNFILGDAFNSRININLREDKGYTYGARTGFSGNDIGGVFTARTGVRTDVTRQSIQEILSELQNYAADGITPTELTFTRSAIGQSDALNYETPFDKLGFLSSILTYDLPDNFVDAQNEILATITKPEIDTLAQKLLPVDEMIAVVVGDRDVILPELEKLDYVIVELDANGLPVSAPQRPILAN